MGDAGDSYGPDIHDSETIVKETPLQALLCLFHWTI